MKIPVTSTIEKFYKQVISLMASFAPIKKLAPKDKTVLAEILYQNYKYRHIKEEIRHVIIFSPKNRLEMCKRIGMSIDSLYQYISILKKHGLLSEENKIPTFLGRILPHEEFEFTILFKIMKDEN